MHKHFYFLVAMALLAASGLPLHSQSLKAGAPVTAVTGESWLSHLARPFGDTSMGKTGHLGPPVLVAGAESSHLQQVSKRSFSTQPVTLHGSDLYRLNCQGCHTESGRGAPPEINSVIDPVRATSATLVMARMKSVGMEISAANAAEMAGQSNAALLQRLHQGGENMPPFPHLNEAEIKALVAYLRQLAGIPGAENHQIAVTESPVRIGEHIAKSTCHICHGATGMDPNPQQLLDGAIPPLETLTTRVSQAELVRKVTNGAPILMGTPPLMCRGRMPVFNYLSEQEAADVYLYLSLYPPDQATDSARAVTLATLGTDGSAGGSGGPGPTSPSEPDRAPTQTPTSEESMHLKAVLLLGTVYSLVIVAMGGGLGFTLWEFKRLVEVSRTRQLSCPSMPVTALTAGGTKPQSQAEQG